MEALPAPLPPQLAFAAAFLLPVIACEADAETAESDSAQQKWANMATINLYMIIHCWLLPAGCWLLSATCWLLSATCYLLAVVCYLLAVVCWQYAGCCLLADGCCMLAAGCWLPAAGCCLLAACCRLRRIMSCWLMYAC